MWLPSNETVVDMDTLCIKSYVLPYKPPDRECERKLGDGRILYPVLRIGLCIIVFRNPVIFIISSPLSLEGSAK
jgi:hypothetical protein